MIVLQRICVISKKCCFTSSESQDVEITEHDPKSHSTNDTTMTVVKSPLPSSAREVLRLTLTIIDTAHNEQNHQYYIYPDGLKGSKRKVSDGCVYAGSLDKEGKLLVNDIWLSEQEKGVGKRHFMIKFNKGERYLESQSYFIKDMGDGLGTFIRVEQPLKLRNLNIVSFGDSHMIVNIDGNLVNLRFIEGPSTDYRS